MRVDEERHIGEDRIIPGITHWPEKLCDVETFLYSKSKFSSHFGQSVQINQSEKKKSGLRDIIGQHFELSSITIKTLAIVL